MAALPLAFDVSAAASADAFSSSDISPSFFSTSSSLRFTAQPLGTPFEGQHVGVTHADLNNDGFPDVLFASGRHWIDQSFALINLGVDESSADDEIKFRFSEALPLGDPGGYYQVSAARLSDLDADHWAVLLAGGTCQAEESNRYGTCDLNSNTPAVLLDVIATGCSAHAPDVPCELRYEEIWRDVDPGGDRNGALSADLGNGSDPSIVLVGYEGVKIFEPAGVDGTRYGTEPSHRVPVRVDPSRKRDKRSDLPRYAGLAVGALTTTTRGPGMLVAGSRSDYDPPPNPNLVYIRNDGKKDDNDGGYRVLPTEGLGGEAYSGDVRYALQSTGLALADLNGDGIVDVAEANYLYPDQIVEGHPLPQRIYFLNEHGDPMEEPTILFRAAGGGRSVAVGNIYHPPPHLLDVAFATAAGEVVLFENLGVDLKTGRFLGFALRDALRTGHDKCQIRDLDVVSLAPCTVSIVCAMTCGWGHGREKVGGNYAFHRKRAGGKCTEEGDKFESRTADLS